MLGGKGTHMNKITLRLVLVSAMLIQSIGLFAAAPGELNYQGKLADNTGTPLTGTYNIRFRICASNVSPCATPGTDPFFDQTYPVTVANGVFSQILSGISAAGFQTNPAPYLLVSVNGTDLAPREALVSSPYALSVAAGAVTDTEVSSVANILPSKIAGGAVPVPGAGVFQSSSYNFPDKVRIGDTTAPSKTLEVYGDINIIGTPKTGGTHGLLLDGGTAVFSNWTVTTGSNIFRTSHVGIGKAYPTTEPGAAGPGNVPPAASLEVSGNINIVDGGTLLLAGQSPVYSNWTQIGTVPNVNIYRASSVGVNMNANPAFPLEVTGADIKHTIGLTEAGNEGPLMVGYTADAANGGANKGYYAVYAP